MNDLKPIQWGYNLEAYILENIEDVAKVAGWPPVVFFERQFLFETTGAPLRLDIKLSHSNGSETAIEVVQGDVSLEDLVRNASRLYSYGLETQYGLIDMPRLVIAATKMPRKFIKAVEHTGLPIKFLITEQAERTDLS